MARKGKSGLPEQTSNPESLPWDVRKFDNTHQIGGIRTATYDYPDTGGGKGCRVALFDTGAGLRFTVNLDRGGDIVECFHQQHSLAYLSPNGYVPPSPAYNQGFEWLRSWSGGLLTSCGPDYVGHPRMEDGQMTPLHGRYSNVPAAVEMVLNPDLQRGRREMLLSMNVRDSRMFDPVLEVRRQIQCALGVNVIHLYDQVINRSSRPCAHSWLYHCNFGYPLLDEGARLLFRGKADCYWNMDKVPDAMPSPARLQQLKDVPAPLPEHAGSGERGVIVYPDADDAGNAHVGLLNDRLGLGVEMIFPIAAMARMANWQHYGPAGTYVVGLEPFHGTLLGSERDHAPEAASKLQPGESRSYRLTILVHQGPEALAQLRTIDGPVKP